MHTIYHGIPIDDAPSPVGDFVLYAGRLSSEKGVETLVAASRLAPRVPIVVVGEGPLAPVVNAAVNGAISYLGRVEAEEVSR